MRSAYAMFENILASIPRVSPAPLGAPPTGSRDLRFPLRAPARPMSPTRNVSPLSAPRPLVIQTVWVRFGNSWLLKPVSFDGKPLGNPEEFVLAEVQALSDASNHFHWNAGGTSWWATDLQTAMRHAELRLGFANHNEWYDFASATGIQPVDE